MPELPEVEHVRRTLTPYLLGARVTRVRVHRPEVIRNLHETPFRSGRAIAAGLLRGQSITMLERHGKQVGLFGDRSALVVHLGMTGQLRFLPSGTRPPHPDHIHVEWSIRGSESSQSGRLIYRDPRRFGGIWRFDSPDQVRQRWATLGPDALRVCLRDLTDRLGRTKRCLKAALLDQEVVAGLGNIYVDESLLDAGLHPRRPACSLTAPERRRLVRSIRRILRHSIKAGGTSIRDYLDADGRSGRFLHALRAYGRAGQPCNRCGQLLRSARIAQRTTVFCPVCQPEAVAVSTVRPQRIFELEIDVVGLKEAARNGFSGSRPKRGSDRYSIHPLRIDA